MKNKVVTLMCGLILILSNMFIFANATNDNQARYLYDLGLFNGKSTTEFIPALDDPTTAAEAIALIGRALKWDVDINATSSFTDVPDWAVPYTEFAKDNGITTGVGNGQFGVDQIDGKRMLTWFLAALGEDKADVWANTEKYSEQYGIEIPTSAFRNDVVYVIYEGIKHPRAGADVTLLEEISSSKSTDVSASLNHSEAKILPGLPITFRLDPDRGAWHQKIFLNEDGTFTGYLLEYYIGLGETYCEFHGKFSTIEQMDAYSYKLRLDELVVDTPTGTSEIVTRDEYIDGVKTEIECKRTYSEPFGLNDLSIGAEFVYYLPSQGLTNYDERFLNWGHYDDKGLERYGLFDVENGHGYYQQFED